MIDFLPVANCMRFHFQKCGQRTDARLLTFFGDGTFYYGANSQWGSFNADSSIFPMDKLKKPVIFKTRF